MDRVTAEGSSTRIRRDACLSLEQPKSRDVLDEYYKNVGFFICLQCTDILSLTGSIPFGWVVGGSWYCYKVKDSTPVGIQRDLVRWCNM